MGKPDGKKEEKKNKQRGRLPGRSDFSATHGMVAKKSVFMFGAQQNWKNTEPPQTKHTEQSRRNKHGSQKKKEQTAGETNKLLPERPAFRVLSASSRLSGDLVHKGRDDPALLRQGRAVGEEAHAQASNGRRASGLGWDGLGRVTWLLTVWGAGD